MSTPNSLNKLIDILHENKIEYYICYKDQHIVTINFWFNDTKIVVDNQGVIS